MKRLLIKNGTLVNRGIIYPSDLLIVNGKIERIDPNIQDKEAVEIDASSLYVLPGIIDDQVHFREPGLTHKASIYTESKAAVSGGVTSFMEMPNTKPPAITQEKLQDKYDIASKTSLANYSFYMGASNDNLEEVLKTNQKNVCGLKVFMGSSTGNMLVDDEEVLDGLFKDAHMLIATHCEDESRIRARTAEFVSKLGENIPMKYHPIIRDEQACYLSSSKAVALAKKYGTKLHILHISTADELDLFDNKKPLNEKRITAELCVHHLSFNASQYDLLGSRIKCNPAIKSEHHQNALLPALLDDTLDVIATDHAPHTYQEKQNPYNSCPSGLPLVQHSLQMMLSFYHNNQIGLEKIVEKMCHAPAVLFEVKDRGFLDEGNFADIILLDIDKEYTVTQENINYKCAWSPLEGRTFKGSIEKTLINGNIVFENGLFNENVKGMRLEFDRD